MALPTPKVDGIAEILELMAASKHGAYVAGNTARIDLYLKIGETVSRRIEAAAWGTEVVPRLAAHIARRHPGQGGVHGA